MRELEPILHEFDMPLEQPPQIGEFLQIVQPSA